MARISEVERAERLVADQRRWINEHGRDLAGYVARYGDSAAQPGRVEAGGRYGNGGQAIYEADMAALHEYEQRLERAQARERQHGARPAPAAVTFTAGERMIVRIALESLAKQHDETGRPRDGDDDPVIVRARQAVRDMAAEYRRLAAHPALADPSTNAWPGDAPLRPSFRPCEVCSQSPAVHNGNLSPNIGHDYR